MKIKKLHIENYKSLKNIDLELNEGINVFIGKNNSGKSNLIDALMFLCYMAGYGKDREARIERYKGYAYEEVVFGKDAQNTITYELGFFLSDKDISSLYAKLGLDSEMSLEEFQKRFNKEVSYLIMIQENHPVLEEVHINFDGNDILYASGSYRDGMYTHEVIQSFKEEIRKKKRDGTLVQVDGRAPAVSILQSVHLHSPIRAEENLTLMLGDFVSSFIPLSPVRESPERVSVLGVFQLAPDASNLPQVLNSLASSKRRLFGKIIRSARDIIEEIREIQASVPQGTSETYLSMTERGFGGKEFIWRHMASGTKEILYLVTLLHTTPGESLLMIEEPEVHLHADAIWKLLSLTETICSQDDKQVFITTHSPTLIDQLPFEKVFTVVKEAGETKVESLQAGKGLEGMLSEAGIPKSWISQRISPAFLLIVEGRDDVKIWGKFLERKGTDPTKVRVVGSGEPGGDKKAVETGKFLKRARIPIPFKIIWDSDNKKKEKEQKLQKEGFKQNEYHVLSKKEIEDYLLDPKAISGITGKSEKEVNEAITNAKGAGKGKLDNVFKNLNFTGPDENVKELLAARVDIPEEILSLIDEVKGYSFT